MDRPRGGKRRASRFEKQQPKPKRARNMSQCSTLGCMRIPTRLLILNNASTDAHPYCVLCTQELVTEGMVKAARVLNG